MKQDGLRSPNWAYDLGKPQSGQGAQIGPKSQHTKGPASKGERQGGRASFQRSAQCWSMNGLLSGLHCAEPLGFLSFTSPE